MKATLYLIRIILAPCLLVLGPLCLLTLINQLVRLGDLVKGSLNNTGLLIEMIFALMPTVFLHASTASAFFGMMLGYEQLNRHSEMVAFRSLGFSLGRLMRPVFYVAFVLCLLLSMLQLYWVPSSLGHLQNLMMESATRTLSEHLTTESFRPLSEKTVIFHQDKHKQNETEEVWEDALISFRSNSEDSGHLILFAPEVATQADAKSRSLYLKSQQGSVYSLQKESITAMDFNEARISISINDWLKNQTRSLTQYHSLSPEKLWRIQKKKKGHRKRWLQFFLVEKVANHLVLFPLLILSALLSFAPKRNLKGKNWIYALLAFVGNYGLYQLFRGLFLSNQIPLWLAVLGPFLILSGAAWWLWRKTSRACT